MLRPARGSRVVVGVDPDGATAALALAEPVWALYGEAGVNARRMRPGDHEVNPTDWAIFIEEARAAGLLATSGGR